MAAGASVPQASCLWARRASRLPNRLIIAWQNARTDSSQLTTDESDCRRSCPSPRRMGLTGLEPVTLRLSSACSNQLSYRPGKLCGQFIVRSEIRNAISENGGKGITLPLVHPRVLPFRGFLPPRPAGFGGKGIIQRSALALANELRFEPLRLSRPTSRIGVRNPRRAL